MTDKTREAFEVWAERQGVSLKRVSERENATYTNYETYLAYHAWQDATAAQAARIRQLEEALRRIVAIENEDFGADWAEIEEARAIASAALKDPS